MSRTLGAIVAIAGLFVSPPPATAASTWYASPSGTSGASGTSPSDPVDIVTGVEVKAGSGDTVVLASGTYALTAGLKIGTDLTLQGAGKTLTLIDLAASSSSVTASIPSGRAVITDLSLRNATGTATTALSVTLGDLDIFQTTFYNNGVGVSLQAGVEVAIEAATFDTNTRAIQDNSGSLVRLANSHLDTGQWGYTSSGGSLAVFQGNHFANFTGHAIYLVASTAGHGALIVANSFDANAVAITSWGSSYTSSNRILDNLIENSTSAGIGLSGYEDSQVEGNRFDGNNVGLNLGSLTAPFVVNNLVTNSTGEGIYLSSGPAVIGFNTIASSGYDGVYVAPGSSALVANNISYGNSWYGVYSDSSSAQVSNNDAFSNAFGNYGGYASASGNLSLDPLFVGAGDYHLQSTSPLLDSADTALISVPIDIDKKARVIDAATGTYPEVGAYEF